jgi:ribosomal 30S subunit maturation factor RimM
VGVLLHRPDSDLLEKISSVILELRGGSVVDAKLESVARMGRGYRVKFAGFSDRTGAEGLRGAILSLPREQLPPIEASESYLVDMVGAKVLGPAREEFGTVVGVRCYPSVDSIVIERPDGSTVEQPLVDDWVEVAEDAPTTIVLTSLEGLL